MGYDDTVGYYMSLSRACVFLPFFASGLYWGKYSNDEFSFEVLEKHRFVIVAILIVLIVVSEYLFLGLEFPIQALYGSYCYADTSTGAALRFFVACCAFLWIFFLISACPNRRIFLISDIGQNTLLIYLLHDIIRWFLLQYHFLHGTPTQNIIGAGVTALSAMIGFYLVSIGCSVILR